MLLHGEQIRQQLSRVKLGGEAVPHRHAGKFRQRLYQRLAVAAILDAVIHAAQHAGGISHRLFVADLAAARAEISDISALIVCGNFERASGAGRVFFEDERDVFALQTLSFATVFFSAF